MIKEEDFILTTSQNVLKEKLDKFLNGPERIFRIIGKPGVGKTTMTKIGLSDLIEKDIEYNSSGTSANVIGIALSHQAKNVLGEHIPNVYTFAKAYGMKEVIHDDGYRSFEFNRFQKEIPIGECSIQVFVHDEVSQYTHEMLSIVLEKTPMFSKIILMGDKGQLPPIESEDARARKLDPDDDSPVFDLELPEDCHHELTERVRQSEGNPILDLSDAIREEIFGNQDIKRILKMINSPDMQNERGFNFIGYDELNDHLKERDMMKTCVIAYRNNTVRHFNIQIRNFLLNEPKDLLIENDIICMLDNYYHERSGIIVYVLNNSDVFQIGRVYNKMVRFSDNDKVYKIESHIGNIKGDMRQIIIPTKEGQTVLDKALEEIALKCRQGKAKWETFWNLKKTFCRCSYGYAVTAYKAQGSTYDTVYVDINDILLTKPISPKRKLQTIYTAITRARFDVYFLKAKR